MSGMGDIEECSRKRLSIVAGVCFLLLALAAPAVAQTWIQLNPAPDPVFGTPSPRYFHAGVYNPVTNRMTIFGGATGYGGNGPVNDVWVLTNADGTGSSAWIKLNPAGGPSPRAQGQFEYDQARNRMIVQGGYIVGGSCSGTAGDTWVLTNADGSEADPPTWISLATTGLAPSLNGAFIRAASAAYDSKNNLLIVWGGQPGECGPSYDNNWVLSNANGLDASPSQWTQLSPANPELRCNFVNSFIGYDPSTDSLVGFAGFTQPCPFGPGSNASFRVRLLGHANGLNGSPAWTDLLGTQTPATWDGSNWIPAAPLTLWFLGGTASSPEAVYDVDRNSLLIPCGLNWSSVQPDCTVAWRLDHANGQGGAPMLTQLNPSGSPPGRMAFTSVYNPVSNRLIMFGGYSGNQINYNDVWVLAGAMAPAPGNLTAHLSVSAPGTTTWGPGGSTNPFSFTVTALDAANNPVIGYTGTVHFTSDDPQAGLPADATLTNGTGTFTATLGTGGVTGIRHLTSTDTGNSAITGTSGDIIVAGVWPTPALLSYSGMHIGETSAAQTATVVNRSGMPLNIAVSIAGSSEFHITQDLCSGTLSDGASCTVQVNYQPSQASSTGTLLFTNSFMDAHISLSGVATVPMIGPFAYIANSGDNTVSVIDTSTNTVVATIPVGSVPQGVAVNPAGTRVYVANTASNNISVIETSSNTVLSTLPVGSGPFGVAVNPSGTRAYITNSTDNTVSVLDTSTNSVVATTPAGKGPFGVVVSPDGSRVYVSNHWDVTPADVSVIDTSTNTIIATISIGYYLYPKGIAISPDGTRVYVASDACCWPSVGNVVTIDTSTNHVVSSVPIRGWLGFGLAVSSSGTAVYVPSDADSAVYILNPSTNSMTPILVPYQPDGLALTPDGARLYMTNGTQCCGLPATHTVQVIDTSTNTVIANVPVGSNPTSFGQFIGPAMSAQRAQTITFPNSGTQAYGAAPFALTATASSGLPVSYTVTSGPATLSGGTLTITGAGLVTLLATQAGNSSYQAAPPVTVSFMVNPAVLTVTADNAAMTYGSSIPAFTAGYSGFVNGDTSWVLSGAPSLTTTATSSSPAGMYPILAAQGTLAAANYAFTFVPGVLTITGLQITTNTLPRVVQGAAYPQTSLTATGGNGALTWTLVNGTVLPPGLDLSTAGVITGTPTVEGTWVFNVQAVDSSNPPQSQIARLTIVVTPNGANNAELNGNYAFLVQGFAPDAGSAVPIYVAAAGSFHADANGNVTGGLIDINTTAGSAIGATITGGGYSVGPDNRGRLRLTTNNAHYGTLTFDIVLGSISSGVAFAGRLMPTSGLGVASGRLARQDATSFSLSVLAGNQAFGWSGVCGNATQLQRFALSGRLSLDSSGNLTNILADDNCGGITGTHTDSGTANIADFTYGRGVVHSHSNNAFYIVSANEAFLISTDAFATAGVVNAGTNKRQASSLSNATLNGTSVIYGQGARTSGCSGANGGGTHVYAGLLTTTGTGNFSVTMDQDSCGTYAQETIGGRYSVDSASGRTTIACATCVPYPPVLYLVGPNEAFMVETDSIASLAYFEPQTGVPFASVPAFINFYGDEAPASPANLRIGVATLSASSGSPPEGSIAGTENIYGYPAGSSSLATRMFTNTYSVDVTGRMLIPAIGANQQIRYIISPQRAVRIDGGPPGNPNPVLMIAEAQQAQQAQTITFPNPGIQTYGVAPFALTATASSGLPVSYAVTSGPATVSGSMLTITGAGSVTVEAIQPGDSSWLAATPVSVTLIVNPATPTVTVNGGTYLYDGNPHRATATATGVDGATVSGSFAFTYSPGGSSVPVGTGTYSASAIFTSANPNYSNAGSSTPATIHVQDFSVSGVAPLTIATGGSSSATVSVNPIAGFSFAVNLTATGLPNGATVSFNPASITPGNGTASSSMTVNISAALTPQTFTFTVTAASDTLSHATAVTVSISATSGSVSNVITTLVAAGAITGPGTASALTSKLTAAQSAIAAGDLKTAINILSAFQNQLNAQAGKHIATSCTIGGVTFNPVTALLIDAQSLIDSLRVSSIPNPITGYAVNSSGVGIAGVTVSIVNSGGSTIASATTDITGFYFFATTGVLVPGSAYSVQVTGVPAIPPSQPFAWRGTGIVLGSFVLN